VFSFCVQIRVKPALHASGFECSVCFFYYRSLTLERAGVNQCKWAIIKETKTYTQLHSRVKRTLRFRWFKLFFTLNWGWSWAKIDFNLFITYLNYQFFKIKTNIKVILHKTILTQVFTCTFCNKTSAFRNQPRQKELNSKVRVHVSNFKAQHLQLPLSSPQVHISKILSTLGDLFTIYMFCNRDREYD